LKAAAKHRAVTMSVRSLDLIELSITSSKIDEDGKEKE
jgi:hypothetical protein